MARLKPIYCVHCPLTGRPRPLTWPLQLLVRHGGALGAVGVTGLLLTVVFWLSTAKTPPIRHCSHYLLTQAALGRASIRSCDPTNSSIGKGRPSASFLPAALGDSFSQSPSPSVPRRGPSGD
jgi:hypothetical protein